MSRTAVIAGVGPGLGAALARRVDAEGCAVGLFARSDEYVGSLAAELDDAVAAAVDIGDPAAVARGFETVREAFGPVVTASAAAWKGTLEIDPDEFNRALDTNVRGALHCAQEAVPDMLDSGSGTVVFTGATTAVRGRERAIGFSAAKFGARGMAESMARELGPKGIHVAHVVSEGAELPRAAQAA
jgi:NAD(P)-dependent dehydrogenase (short-subunit alcohol dehydrogenase family)